MTEEQVLNRLREYFNTDFKINSGINSDDDTKHLYVRLKNGRYKVVTAIPVEAFMNNIDVAIEKFKPLYDFMVGEIG